MDNTIELLFAKLRDCIRGSAHRPCFLGFLDESQAALCKDYLKREPARHMFFGGYADAQRVMVGFFPDYMEPAQEA